MDQGISYSTVARLWAWVFLAVGLLFLVIPQPTAHCLTLCANGLGLSGAIVAPTGNLWYVLALSLMATITVCAWWSADYPWYRPTYYGLLVAKVVSTVGFAVMAWRQAPAWAICAAGDGLVAFTLWGSARWEARQRKSPLLPQLARVYAGHAPHYEVWFGKIDLAPQTAFWFRYTLLDGKQQEACTWAILFAPEGIQAGKDVCHLRDLSPGNCVIVPNAGEIERFREKPQVFHLGSSFLNEGNALGRAGSLSWDLTFEDRGRRFEHVPQAMQRLHLAKSVLSSCYLDLRFSGVITQGTHEIRFAQRPGMIGHIYGQKQAQEWAWVHCNSFEEAPDVVLEGISARISLGGRTTPALSSFVLYMGDRVFAFSSLWKMARAQSHFGQGKWVFKTSHQGITLAGEVEVPQQQQVAVVTYTDTDGSLLWCHNSKLSHLRLRLIDAGRGIEQTWVARETAAFEIVQRIPPNQAVTL